MTLVRRHVIQQLLVELIRHVVAQAAELLVKGGNGDHAGGIAAGANGHLDMRDLLAEQFVGAGFQTDAVDFVQIRCGFEGDDEVEAFVGSDRGEAVEVGDVDDADSADFHVAA